MNTITIIVTVLVLWLIMGLGFTTAYVDARRSGKTKAQAWQSHEGIMFIISVALPLLIGLFRVVA